MKSQKGIALTSIIVYIIVMLVTLGIISIITSFFYKNVNEIGKNTEPEQEYTRFARFFAEDVNKDKITVEKCSEAGEYIVFSDGTQYTFKNQNIYRNKVLICQGIYEVKFDYIEGSEDEREVIKVEYKATQKSDLKNSEFTLDK